MNDKKILYVKIVKLFVFVNLSFSSTFVEALLCNTKHQAKTGTALYIERTKGFILKPSS